LVFVPSDDEVYPTGYDTWVEVGSVAEPLEGQCRPGHFRGVATIVLKLFNMVGADVAYFGQKDFQQALVIQRMAVDLNVPIEIRVCPIVREADGLAMSSRNRYLTGAARQRSGVLWKSLCLAGDLVQQGERRASVIAEEMRRLIEGVVDTRIEYIALVDPQTLQPVETIASTTLTALAVRVGATRLIDNRLLEPLGDCPDFRGARTGLSP
jgi:pantoate--beta-alanine ligase